MEPASREPRSCVSRLSTAQSTPQTMPDSKNHVWVFGYGSLCWHPGFPYLDSVTGYVTGYARRFWQGNTTHRGTPSKPGRVATLVEDKEGVVWGRAFLVSDPRALPYLDQRECKLGGYTTCMTPFQPHHAACPSFQALVYLATPDNGHWLGEAPEADIASQILSTSGPSGHNVEYLLRLAEFMREHIPGAEDDHLFCLEELVRAGIEEKNLCLSSLMGASHREPQPAPPQHQLYTSMVTSKKLRCLSA